MSATVDKVEEKKVTEKTLKEVDQGVTTGVLAAVTHLLSTSTATELAEEELVKAGIQKALHIKALFGRSKADMATVLDTVLRMDSFRTSALTPKKLVLLASCLPLSLSKNPLLQRISSPRAA
jgi:hypothetical protein